ncbi:hypothetical protein FACS18942_08770 [Planctomycetales bacterium]|nr:hypothetical protein FACS18942_08770 [Planctomycetales bacterium]
METLIDNAVAMQQEQIATKIQFSMLKKTMDVQKDMGEAIIGLIDNAASVMQTPGKTIGLGNNFDAYA